LSPTPGQNGGLIEKDLARYTDSGVQEVQKQNGKRSANLLKKKTTNAIVPSVKDGSKTKQI